MKERSSGWCPSAAWIGPFSLFLASLAGCVSLERLEVTVVNRSGHTLEDLVLSAPGARHRLEALGMGGEYKVEMERESARDLNIAFTLNGEKLAARCGGAGSSGGAQTVIVLSGGEQVVIDYGGRAQRVEVTRKVGEGSSR
jgi:hypothetical protein